MSAPRRRMADLISLLIWQPLGAEFDAEITCDGVSTAIHDGGMSAEHETWPGSANCS